MSDTLKIKVLYVDDEESNLGAFKASFRRDFTILTASSAKEAREILSSQEIHVLITDQKMPITTGTQLLETAIENYPDQARIILSAYTDNESIVDAFQKGLIHRFVLKPFNEDELREIILSAYETYNLKKIKNQLYQEWLMNQKELDLFQKKKETEN